MSLLFYHSFLFRVYFFGSDTKIMAENGKDIEAVKTKTKADEQSLAEQKSEIESLKTQLAEANNAIDGFKELDVEGIKKAAQEWETKAKEAELKRQSNLENLKFDYALRDKLKELKAKDAEIVAGLLNKDDLKITEKGEVLGLDEQLKTLKKDKGFLFEDDKAAPEVNITGGTNSPQGSTEPTSIREALAQTFKK